MNPEDLPTIDDLITEVDTANEALSDAYSIVTGNDRIAPLVNKNIEDRIGIAQEIVFYLLRDIKALQDVRGQSGDHD